MSTQNTSEEIDLGYIFKKSNDFFKSLLRLFFLIVAFFLKYIVIVIILLIVGVAIGYFQDKKKDKILDNELIVIPNFESADYLYSKVEALNNKKKAEDSLYFKSFLGDEFDNFIKIEIEPIVDVYAFMAEKKENLETLKVLYDDKDLDKFLISKSLSKHYKYHQITIKTKGENYKEVSDKILDYLNDNEHFKNYQIAGIEDAKIQIMQNERMISQIDSILKNVANEGSKKNSPSVFINSQSELYQLVNVKQFLLEKRIDLQKEAIDQNQIIKLVSGNYGLVKGNLFSFSNKIKMPLLLILLFSGFFFLGYIYRKMKYFAETDSKSRPENL